MTKKMNYETDTGDEIMLPISEVTGFTIEDGEFLIHSTGGSRPSDELEKDEFIRKLGEWHTYLKSEKGK